MDRRQRNSLHARILAIGLGLSLVIHVALIGFGRLSFLGDSSGRRPLDLVTLPQPDAEPEEPRAESATGWRLALDITLDEQPRVETVSEYDDVLAEALSAELRPPLVPRPHRRAVMAETGFTPIRVPQTDRLTRRGGSVDRGSGGGLGGVIIVIGGGGFGPIDDCTPSGRGGRYPGGRRF